MPVTFLVDLPLLQVIVFLAAATTPSITTFDVADTGARVAVPACDAVIAQFPRVNRFKVDPAIEQIPVDVVEKVTAPPLDAVADRATVLEAKFAVAGGVNVIVWELLVISKEDLYKSEAR